MANRFVALSTGTNNNPTCNIDTTDGGASTAIVPGDNLVAFVNDDIGDGTVTVPAGFTIRATITITGPDTHRFSVYTKTAGTEPDSYAFTTTSSFTNISAALIVDDDLDETSIVVGTWAQDTATNTGNTTVTYNGITSPTGGTVYALVGTDNVAFGENHVFTPPTSYTGLYGALGSSNWSSLAGSERAGFTGATGNITQNINFVGSGGGFAAILIAFAPNAAGGVNIPVVMNQLRNQGVS